MTAMDLAATGIGTVVTDRMDEALRRHERRLVRQLTGILVASAVLAVLMLLAA